MKNKTMLFSSNGKLIKEIENDQLKFKSELLTLGETGVVNFHTHVTFIKKDNHSIGIEDKFEHLEVYVFDQLVFKGIGYYGEARHSSLYIIAEIEGDIFKIHFKGNAEENVSVLKNCQLYQ